jgi:hypothetical protein
MFTQFGLVCGSEGIRARVPQRLATWTTHTCDGRREGRIVSVPVAVPIAPTPIYGVALP